MPVKLIPFDPQAFQGYLEDLVPHYTADKVAAGNINPEGAEDQIRKEIQQLIPQGLQTPHHTLFTILDPDIHQQVGILWVYFDPQDGRKQAFIYDLLINETYRRRGYASQALLELEEYLRPKGVCKIGLHVFGFNTGAQALYHKLGYQITNIHMAKQLG